MRFLTGRCRPGKRRGSSHVGILLRLQENSLRRQPRRQTTVRLPGLEPGQDAAGVPGPASRCGAGHRRRWVRASPPPARVFTAAPNASLYKILYVHFSSGSALDLLRQIALELDLEPAHFRGDLVRQIASAIVRLNQSKKQHPILICDEAHLLPHPALEQLPLLLNFDMDSSRYLTLLLVGQPLLRRTLSLQMHEALRQRIGNAVAPGGTHARRTRRLSGATTQSRRRVAAPV